MKKLALLPFLLGTTFAALGQDDSLTLDDVMQNAQEWTRDNFDENFLRSLGEMDQEKVKKFLNEIEKKFKGEYVIDLGQLRDAAKVILPILESHDDTLPYAEWLKTRFDYLDTANELPLIIPAPKPEAGKPPPPIPNPPPTLEREIWIKKISDRPWPDKAKPYVSKLKPVFAKENVPPELVWIAEVESSFDSRARSPAGAAGMFQLMPNTAKRYGLRSWPFDQRLDSETSARAAAKYLNYLYDRFKDWRLALAAYNAGEGTVQKLLDRSKLKAYDAIAIRLPAETQMYVPKVEATLLRREGIKLADLPAPRG